MHLAQLILPHGSAAGVYTARDGGYLGEAMTYSAGRIVAARPEFDCFCFLVGDFFAVGTFLSNAFGAGLLAFFIKINPSPGKLAPRPNVLLLATCNK
jgi:hypothetical protein